MTVIATNRVLETSTTTGTGPYSFVNTQAFHPALSSGETVTYHAFDPTTGGWEDGTGTWATGGTFTRTVITASSNANNAVSWGTGTRKIYFNPNPTSGTGDVVGTGSSTVGNIAIFDSTTGLLIKDGGLPPAEVLISEVNPSATSTVTFSSLGTTRSLRITGMARSTESAAFSILKCTFNADTAGNYINERDLSSGTTPQASNAETSFTYAAAISAFSSPSGTVSSFNLCIPDFANTTFHKNPTGISTLRLSSGVVSTYVISLASYWLNTAAITSITLSLGAGTFVSGSRISLYGVN